MASKSKLAKNGKVFHFYPGGSCTGLETVYPELIGDFPQPILWYPKEVLP
jgi:hypothetical protein